MPTFSPTIFFIMLILVLLVILLVFMKSKRTKKKITFTPEFKEKVQGIDLTLSDDQSEITKLEDSEEILKALKELYDNQFISKEIYQKKSEATIKQIHQDA